MYWERELKKLEENSILSHNEIEIHNKANCKTWGSNAVSALSRGGRLCCLQICVNSGDTCEKMVDSLLHAVVNYDVAGGASPCGVAWLACATG